MVVLLGLRTQNFACVFFVVVHRTLANINWHGNSSVPGLAHNRVHNLSVKCLAYCTNVAVLLVSVLSAFVGLLFYMDGCALVGYAYQILAL